MAHAHAALRQNAVRNLLCGTVVLSSFSVAGSALAQSSGSVAAQPSHGAIEEIIVTAQRRSENLQNVPIAVAAVTAEKLKTQGITSTQDLSRVVPSLTITNFVGYSLPRIRGIGNNVIGAGYESGVATYIDGVYLAAAPASLLSLNNIERIEVLKGPQGTLFGRNATGGLIQIITKEPSQTFGGEASVSYGNYETSALSGYVTGGLADGVALDFAGQYSHQGNGYGTNRATGQDVNKLDEDLALRSSLLVKPGSDTKIRVTGDYEKNRGSIFTALRQVPGITPSFPPGTTPPYRSQDDLKSPWDIDSDAQPYTHLSSWGVSGRVDQGLGFAHLVSITAYRSANNLFFQDADSTAVPFITISAAQKDTQFSQELQLGSSEMSPIKWIAGVYYFRGISRYDPVTIALFGTAQPATPFGAVGTSEIVSRLTTSALAGYGEVTVPLGHATNVTGGFRYTTERRTDHTDTSIGIVGGPSGIPTGTFDPAAKRFSKPTWRLSVDHRFSPEIMTYASYNRGFKSGGFNGLVPTDPPFQPERIDAFEVGFKSDFFDRRVRLDGAAFYYKYKNIQVAKYDGQVTSYYNGPSATIYGLDMDVDAVVTRSFSVTGGMTLLHDKFGSFANAQFAYPVNALGDATGNQLPQAPHFQASLGGDWHMKTGFGEAGANLSYSYDSGYYTATDNILRQPHFSQLAAELRLKLDNGFGVRVWGRNLTNAKVAQVLSNGTYNAVVSYAAPRTFGATLEGHF